MNADEFLKFKREDLPALTKFLAEYPVKHRWLDQVRDLIAAFDYLDGLQDTTTPRIPLSPISPGSSVFRPTHWMLDTATEPVPPSRQGDRP